jgi:hypothetical protein
MKTARLLALASACLAPAFAGYTYDFPNQLNPYDSYQWAANGFGNNISTNMYTSSDSVGGALISSRSFPAPSSSYEVRGTLALGSSGGNYVFYLRATSNSLLANGNAGTFYAVQIANPTFSGGSCAATLNIYKNTGANTLTTLTSTTVYCYNGMVVRVVMTQGGATKILVVGQFQIDPLPKSSLATSFRPPTTTPARLRAASRASASRERPRATASPRSILDIWTLSPRPQSAPSR